MDYKHICNIGILNLVACRADQSEHLQFENKLGHVNPIFGLITNMQKNYLINWLSSQEYHATIIKFTKFKKPTNKKNWSYL